MGYEDFTAGEIIRQEFGAVGYLKPTGNNRIIGYNGLTAAGRNLLNGGNLDINYDYNVFDNSADVGNDTSYMGIMYNGSTGGGSTTASMNNTSWKIDWSNSTFDLAHTYANPIAFNGATQSGSTGTTGENNSKYTGYKMDKDKDGKYCATYFIDGKKVTRDKYALKYKDDAAKASAELKKLNGQA